MIKGVILVDFDNAFYGVALNAPNIKMRLNTLVEHSLNVCHDLDEIAIRLYGGWKMNGLYTSQASTVLGCLETVKSELFPVIYQRRQVKGNIELVVSQYNLDIEWESTLQEKSTRHHLSVIQNPSRHCHNDPERCPLHMVALATQGREVVCPNEGCERIDASQFIRIEQKMVDSMMTCDILEYTHDTDYRLVEVVSDDVDMHPALALAGEKYAGVRGVSLLLMVKNKKKCPIYQQQLGSHNIVISTWQ